jgi:hypothetical protein
MGLQEVMAMTEADQIGELRLPAVLDRDDVIALQPVPDTAARNGTDAVPARER